MFNMHEHTIQSLPTAAKHHSEPAPLGVFRRSVTKRVQILAEHFDSLLNRSSVFAARNYLREYTRNLPHQGSSHVMAGVVPAHFFCY